MIHNAGIKHLFLSEPNIENLEQGFYILPFYFTMEIERETVSYQIHIR